MGRVVLVASEMGVITAVDVPKLADFFSEILANWPMKFIRKNATAIGVISRL